MGALGGGILSQHAIATFLTRSIPALEISEQVAAHVVPIRPMMAIVAWAGLPAPWSSSVQPDCSLSLQLSLAVGITRAISRLSIVSAYRQRREPMFFSGVGIVSTVPKFGKIVPTSSLQRLLLPLCKTRLTFAQTIFFAGLCLAARCSSLRNASFRT